MVTRLALTATNEAEVASVAQAGQAQVLFQPTPGFMPSRADRLRRRTGSGAGPAQAPDDSGRGAPNPPAISCSRIFLRPRCSRDITVPTGVPMISAISRYG